MGFQGKILKIWEHFSTLLELSLTIVERFSVCVGGCWLWKAVIADSSIELSVVPWADSIICSALIYIILFSVQSSLTSCPVPISFSRIKKDYPSHYLVIHFFIFSLFICHYTCECLYVSGCVTNYKLANCLWEAFQKKENSIFLKWRLSFSSNIRSTWHFSNWQNSKLIK